MYDEYAEYDKIYSTTTTRNTRLVSTRLPIELVETLTLVAKYLGTNKTQLIIESIEYYIEIMQNDGVCPDEYELSMLKCGDEYKDYYCY